jgi:hypothetical protein
VIGKMVENLAAHIMCSFFVLFQHTYILFCITNLAMIITNNRKVYKEYIILT